MQITVLQKQEHTPTSKTNFYGHSVNLYTVLLLCIYYINRTTGTQTTAYNKCTQSEISAQTANNEIFIPFD